MSRALGLRIDPVLLVVASVAFGATEAVAPRATAVAALVTLAALARRVGRVVVALAALGMLVGAARARFELDAHARRFERAREFLPSPSRCSARGRVTASPTWLDQGLRIEARLTELDCEGRRHDGEWPARLQLASARLFHGDTPQRPPPARSLSPGARDHLGSPAPSSTGIPPDLARGDEFSVVADLAPVSEFRNFLLPDPRPRAARRGVLLSGGALSFEIEVRAFGAPALIDRARGHVRERIHATFGERVSGMARALVLGENDLDPADEEAFQRSGLSHLLAVSGTHLILAVLALLRGLEAVARRVPCLSARLDVRRPVALLGCCLGPLYADFAGGSGSAWRAAWMLCAVLAVRAAGRHVFPSRVLAASLAAGWLSDALVVFDPSFSLSLAATTGLLAFGQRQQETHLQATLVTQPRRPDPARLAATVSQAALTTLAATLPCVPILLAMSPGLSLASVAANLLAAPVGEALALPLCLIHALSAPIPPLEQGLALVASGALGLIRAVAHGGAAVDWLYFDIPPPTEWHHAAIIAGATACIAASGRAWLEPSAPNPVPAAAEHLARARNSLHDPVGIPSGAAEGVSSARSSRRGAMGISPGPAHRLLHAGEALRRDIGSRQRPAARLWLASRLRRVVSARRRAPKLSSSRALLATLLALIAIESATRWQHSAARMRREGRLRITALDVGQGDATLVDLPDGRLMLIDAGGFVGIPIDPGERVILPTLRARRRDRIDILVLTHPHPDHYGGLASVVRELDIGEFWYGGPEGGSPSGRHPSGARASGGHPSGGQPSGGQPSGGHPSGGQPSGGQPSGARTSGGHPSGARASGGHPSGARASGGHPSGGHPSGARASGGHPRGGQPSGARASAPEAARPPSGSGDSAASARRERRRTPAGSSYSELLALLRQRGVPLRPADELCTGNARVDAPIQLLHPCATATERATAPGAAPATASTAPAVSGEASATAPGEASATAPGEASATAPGEASATAPGEAFVNATRAMEAPSANDASFVVRVSNGRHAALGDAEHRPEGEALVTATPVEAPSANDASLVVRVSNGRHAALLVGDAEHWAEQRLLATRAELLDADFLKVGHHGSRTSSGAAFLARVTPSVATISAGIRNRFGHPHAEALAHLAAVGARTLRLDQIGAASWESDGDAITITTFAPERPR